MVAFDSVISPASVRMILKQRSILRTLYCLDEESSPNAIVLALAKETVKEFAELLPHLPTKIRSILDIGCGLGMIHAFLSPLYDEPAVHLVDGEETEGHCSGYTDEHKFPAYNSMDTTLAFLSRCGLNHLRPLSIGEDLPSCDLVLSLRAWGWHFPIEGYAKKIRSACSDATIIIDLRKGIRPSLKTRMIGEGFAHVGTVCERADGHREVFRVA